MYAGVRLVYWCWYWYKSTVVAQLLAIVRDRPQCPAPAAVAPTPLVRHTMKIAALPFPMAKSDCMYCRPASTSLSNSS